MLGFHMLKEKSKAGRRGQALIESALVLIAYFSMLIFILDMGRLLVTQQFLSDRARSGARWAALNTWDPTAVANMVCYNTATAPEGSSTGLFGLTPSMVAASRSGTSGNWDYRVIVTIQNYPMFMLIPYISGKYVAPPITVAVPVGAAGAVD